MLSEQEKKTLVTQLRQKEKKLAELRQKLNSINTQKEHWFSQKEQHKEDILKHISDIKSAKNQRNKFTNEVKGFKERRKLLNDSIKQKISEVMALNKDKQDLAKKHNIEGDPAYLMKQIEKLEFKIETEAISFEKEKELMKVIKDKKKQLQDAKIVSEVFGRARQLSNEIDVMKREADEVHVKVQSLANESQKRHEEILAKSKEVDELRVKEEECYKKFFEFKQQFSDVNNELKKELDEYNKLSGNMQEFRIETKKAKEERKEQQLKELEGSVEEKIKKGKKLTTEDLLVFQAQLKDEEEKDE